jgi:hypothetical protein
MSSGGSGLGKCQQFGVTFVYQVVFSSHVRNVPKSPLQLWIRATLICKHNIPSYLPNSFVNWFRPASD